MVMEDGVCVCVHRKREMYVHIYVSPQTHTEWERDKPNEREANADNGWIWVKSIQEFLVYWRIQIPGRGNFLYYIEQSWLEYKVNQKRVH